MAMSLYDSAPGDPRNALFLAGACDLAYYDEPEGCRRFREELGLEVRLISADNTQVYVGGNDQAVVVAFRGSQAPTTLDGVKDWLLTNANNYLILPEGRSGTDFAAAGVGARFHRGFLEALEMVWGPLSAMINQELKAKDRPLWVTGHSLGGALALLAAWRFQRNFLPVSAVVTFGAPMVGNKAASDAFEREFPAKIFRYVDIEDVVPLLPSVSLVANAYSHCQSEVCLSPDQARAAAVELEALRSTDRSASDDMLTAATMDQIWGTVKGRITAHLIASYQTRVQTRCKELG
ncbi:MAG: lipase family protein [Isosphaeraceae bacterium]